MSGRMLDVRVLSSGAPRQSIIWALVFVISGVLFGPIDEATGGGPNPPEKSCVLDYQPINDGYEMRVTAFDGIDFDLINFSLRYQSGTDTLTHEWDFATNRMGTVKIRDDLARCRIRSGEVMGDYGKVDVTLSSAQPSTPIENDEECYTGTARTTDVFSGVVKLNSSTEFFGTIKKTSWPNTQSEERVYTDECAAQADCFLGDAALKHLSEDGFLTIRQPDSTQGSTSFHFTHTRYRKQAAIRVTATSILPNSSFTYADDFSSATITGSGSLFSGTATFAATESTTTGERDCGTRTQRVGQIDPGNFRIRVDTRPDRPFPMREPFTFMLRDEP